MSKLSIYETKWIDLVFEGRNKEYGAYQLRQENPKTTLMALFTGLLLVTVLSIIPVIVNHFTVKEIVRFTPVVLEPMSKVVFPPKQPEKPVKSLTPPPKKIEVPKEQPVEPKSGTMVVTNKKEDTTDEVPKNKEINNNPIETGNSSGNENGTNTNGAGSDNSNKENGNGTAILPSYELDKNPEFPGGIKNFLKYVGTNFRTPEIELDKTIKVFVSFVVEKDGSMTNIEVKKDPGYGLGAEAIRVLKSLKTKWEPGIKNGQPVRAYYNLPISIEIR